MVLDTLDAGVRGMTECTVCHTTESSCRDRYGRHLCKLCLEYESQFFDLAPQFDADGLGGIK